MTGSHLLDTHPRLGLAQYRRNQEIDHTGDYHGQDVCEVLRLDHTIGSCRQCGAREHRFAIVERLLLGCNRGQVVRWWSYTRPDCMHGSGASNYRVPWGDR